MMTIDEQLCDVCGTCVGVCPADAVAIVLNRAFIDNEACILCRACEHVCPVRAISSDIGG